jgi:hypothetical protein
MPNDRSSAQVAWIVVEVQSGIPVSVRPFLDFESADQYSELLRTKLNLDDDETGVFEIEFDGN